MSEKKIDRRKYLKYAGAAVAVGAVAAAGYGLSQYSQPTETTTPSATTPGPTTPTAGKKKVENWYNQTSNRCGSYSREK